MPVCPGESYGNITVEAIGGAEPYRYEWENNTQGAILDGIDEGNYFVRVVDANGCSASLNITKEERFPKMIFPNSFSPNGDGVNDYFAPISPCIPIYDINIYDRWGNLVFQQIEGRGVWDGSLNDEDLPADVYVYYVSYDNLLPSGNYREKIRGQVRLMR